MMTSKANNINLTKSDILQLMIESYKTGCISYMDMAEDFCKELLEEFVAGKLKTLAEVSVEIPTPEPKTRPYAEFPLGAMTSSNLFLNTSPASSSGFININSNESSIYSLYNTLEFNTTTFYNNNNT